MQPQHDTPAETDAEKVGCHVVDVKSAIGKQILHTFGDDADETPQKPYLPTPEPANIHEKPSAKDVNGGVNKVVQPDAKDEIVQRLAQSTQRRPHEDGQKQEVVGRQPSALLLREITMTPLMKSVVTDNATRLSSPFRAGAGLQSAVFTLNMGENTFHIGRSYLFFVGAGIATKDDFVLSYSNNSVQQIVISFSIQHHIQTSQRPADGRKDHLVAVAMQSGLHAETLERQCNLTTFRQQRQRLLKDDGIGNHKLAFLVGVRTGRCEWRKDVAHGCII